MRKKPKQTSTLHAVDSRILQFFHSCSTMFLKISTRLFRGLVQAILRKYTYENAFCDRPFDTTTNASGSTRIFPL